MGREVDYLRDAIRRGQLAGDGYYTAQSSALIAELSGARKVLLTHSCTAALEMAAILSDLEPGDEIILPSYTFVSTANSAVLRGAVPVFVDIDADTLNIDPAEVAAAVTPRTKAICAVHYAGFPAEMDHLAEIARDNGLMLIEDAAHALGSRYKGRPAGSLGDMGAFSFHETKNLISGEGGALTLNRPELFERAEIIREKGTDRSRFLRGDVDKYTWVDIGSSFLPGELVASYLFAQLELAELINTHRLSMFNRYMEAFADLEAAGRVRRPRWPEHCEGNGHLFYLILRDAEDRDGFIAHMRAQGIGTPFHYVPLHNSPGGLRYGRVHGSLEVTDLTAERLVRLPIYFDLGADIETVVEQALAYLTSGGTSGGGGA